MSNVLEIGYDFTPFVFSTAGGMGNAELTGALPQYKTGTTL